MSTSSRFFVFRPGCPVSLRPGPGPRNQRGIGLPPPGVTAPGSGITSRSPIRRMRLRSVKPFACMIASTVTPYRWAIRLSVSPPSTTWNRCCTCGVGDGDGDGCGERTGGGLEIALGAGSGVTPAAGAGVADELVPDVPRAQLTAKNKAITPTTSTAPRISVYAPRAARSFRPRPCRPGRPGVVVLAAPSGTAWDRDEVRRTGTGRRVAVRD